MSSVIDDSFWDRPREFFSRRRSPKMDVLCNVRGKAGKAIRVAVVDLDYGDLCLWKGEVWLCCGNSEQGGRYLVSLSEANVYEVTNSDDEQTVVTLLSGNLVSEPVYEKYL